MALKLVKNQRDGTTFTAVERIPDNHSGVITITLDIDQADWTDTTLSCKFSIFILIPGDKWQHYASGEWFGDPEVDRQPSIAIDSTPARGKLVRVELSVPKRMRVGVEAVW